MIRRQASLSLAGQDDNIGDVVLRRPLLKLLRRFADLHLYLGDASPGFIEALQLAPQDRVYEDAGAWRRQLWRSAHSPSFCFAFRPGQSSLTRSKARMLRQLAPSLMLGRACGGTLVNLGAGVHESDPLVSWLMKPVLRLAQCQYWREPVTAAQLGFGGVMPDWAFAEGSSRRQLLEHRGERPLLTVSLRGDRPLPSPRWCDAILAAAARFGLEPAVVTQVRRDDAGSRAIAARLGAQLYAWDEQITHAGQERRLREVYRRSRLVVSDRLHVLILAMTEGAVPSGLTENPRDKIARHFAVLGLADIGRDVSGWTAAAVTEALGETLARAQQCRERLFEARRRIAAIEQEVAARLGRQPAINGRRTKRV